MQPNVTPGAILELHAAKANNGTSPGINSPLTTTWTDTSGNGNDGTLVNYIGLNAAPWGDGKLESVAASPMPYVNLGTNPIFDLTSGVTMEVWVWTTKTNNQQLIAKSYGTSYYMNMSQSVGNSAFSAFIGGRSVVASVADYGLHGRLVHLVATGDASLLQLFADGQRLNFTTGQAPRADTYPLQVGGYNNVGAFVGSMYLARIYPFALSAAQVQQNYNAGTGW